MNTPLPGHPTDVACPFCHAAPGAVCTVTLTDGTTRRRYGASPVHSARQRDYLAQLRAPATEIFLYLDGDPPMTCPHCGARTDFTEHGEGADYHQDHTCLNPACGFTFRAEEDTDPEEDDDSDE